MLVKGQPTMLIAVMGVTGSGKSTFVRTASGNNKVTVGHSLEACTQEINAYEFNARGHNIILVDTPGFSDTYKSDTEILVDLAKWLEGIYRQNTKLTGILYLHRITDVRMDGSAMRNLKMFRKLCGEDPMKNVAILSTFWGKDDKQVAIDHEDELKSNPSFWGSMIDHGAQVQRFDGTESGALDVLMSFATKATMTLDIQRELVDEDKLVGETAAGNAVNEELHRLETKYRDELGRIQKETAEALAERDVQYEKILNLERERMEQKLERINSDQEMLRQERREEIRRIENDNKLLQSKYDTKLKEQQLEAERIREEDRAETREKMQNSEALIEALKAQKSNDALVSIGGKVTQVAALGAMAAFDPNTIPVVLAALVDLAKEF
ncbi:P-loop containing protein [Fusarium sp. NRRL 52700]|nr:P-loop containing protein [Fusarium sp. NRRL 52700]